MPFITKIASAQKTLKPLALFSLADAIHQTAPSLSAALNIALTVLSDGAADSPYAGAYAVITIETANDWSLDIVRRDHVNAFVAHLEKDLGKRLGSARWVIDVWEPVDDAPGEAARLLSRESN